MSGDRGRFNCTISRSFWLGADFDKIPAPGKRRARNELNFCHAKLNTPANCTCPGDYMIIFIFILIWSAHLYTRSLSLFLMLEPAGFPEMKGQPKS